MSRDRPVRVLLDASVLRRGHFAGGAIKVQRTKWGDNEFDVKIPGFVKRADHKDEWTRTQIRCIPTIARLVREGIIEGYISDEIQYEVMMGRRDDPIVGNVFYGVPLKKARVPLYRSRFIQGGWDATFGKKGLLWVREQLRRLQPIQARALLGMPELAVRFEEFEKGSLCGIGVFHDICRGLADRHLADAYHFWTAERNGLDIYCLIEKNSATR